MAIVDTKSFMLPGFFHRISVHKLQGISSLIQGNHDDLAIKQFTREVAAKEALKQRRKNRIKNVTCLKVFLFFDLGDEVVDVVEEVELRTISDLIYIRPDEIFITTCTTVFYPYSKIHIFLYAVRCL